MENSPYEDEKTRAVFDMQEQNSLLQNKRVHAGRQKKKKKMLIFITGILLFLFFLCLLAALRWEPFRHILKAIWIRIYRKFS